jgi:hypothetical protein
MSAPRSFFAYPADPEELTATIRRALDQARTRYGDKYILGWEENDIAGRPLTDPIFGEIANRPVTIADVSFLNFNVAYEAGYAIGQGKRLFLVLNTSMEGESKEFQKVGIFDTLGYKKYENSEMLFSHISALSDAGSIRTDFPLNTAAPLYYVGAEANTDFLIRLFSRIKKTRFRFRSFDPHEQPRLGALEAIENVASSAAVVVPLLAVATTGSKVHNIRAAFVAGLAHGLGRSCLILQPDGGPAPVDVRDMVKTVRRLEQIDEYIADLVPRIVEATYGAAPLELAPEGILQRLDFGDGIAENEASTLKSYHVATDQFRSVLNGSIRLVVGRKGSGKTAVFYQARDRWRQDKDNVVVDLKPEGYRLRKLRDLVLVYLAEGSQEQLLIAFWEYLLLVEIVQNILEEDYSLHLRDHNLTKPYQHLATLFIEGGYSSTTDFSERMTKLIDRITEMFGPQQPPSEGQRRLSDDEVLSLIYQGCSTLLSWTGESEMQHADANRRRVAA